MRLQILKQILAWLEHVHTRRLVHLDLKPGNILRKALDGGDKGTIGATDAATIDAALWDQGLRRAAGMLLQQPYIVAGFMPPEITFLTPATPSWALPPCLELPGWHRLTPVMVS
jgi:serine/threonine protein kinase